MVVSIRIALPSDIDAIVAWDTEAANQMQRRRDFESWVAANNAVVVDDDGVAGYAVLDYSFFGQGFVAMLHVAPSRRRQGLATALFRYLERTCRTAKLFTSTNESNAAMRSLMSSLGYLPSGIVYNLDENDPELFFFKQLRP